MHVCINFLRGRMLGKVVSLINVHANNGPKLIKKMCILITAELKTIFAKNDASFIMA